MSKVRTFALGILIGIHIGAIGAICTGHWYGVPRAIPLQFQKSEPEAPALNQLKPGGVRPLGKTASSALSHLSAFAEWFKDSGYKEEWLEQVKRFENDKLYTGSIDESVVHDDRLNSNVREVGYGITAKEVFEAKRLGFLPADATLPERMSKAEADQWFETITLPTYEKCVEEVVRVPLTKEQKFALISFCHNLGKGSLAKLTMQDGRLKDSNYSVIADCINKYVFANKKKANGLVRRRQWEASLWQSGTVDRLQVVSR